MFAEDCGADFAEVDPPELDVPFLQVDAVGVPGQAAVRPTEQLATAVVVSSTASSGSSSALAATNRLGVFA